MNKEFEKWYSSYMIPCKASKNKKNISIDIPNLVEAAFLAGAESCSLKKSSSKKMPERKGDSVCIRVPPYAAVSIAWASDSESEEKDQFVETIGPCIILCNID